MLASKGEHFSGGGREVELDEEFGVVGGFMADDGDWASPGLTDTGGGLRCTRILEHLINSLLKNSGTPVSEPQRRRRGMSIEPREKTGEAP